MLDPSGALWLSDEKLLVVADLHLEKGTAWAGRGVFLPPYDSRMTLGLLRAVIDTYAPEGLVFLGDSFHDCKGPDRLQGADRELLANLTMRQNTWWITGNHDPELAEGLSGISCDELCIDAVRLCHIPEPLNAGAFQISGHLHPVATVSGRGRTLRRRCFAADANRLILPAFGAYTGGLNIRDKAFKGLFDPKSFAAHVIGDRQIYPFPGIPFAR